MSSVLLNKAKQDLARWFDRVHHHDKSSEAKQTRRRLLAGLELALRTLPERESWREVSTRVYPIDGLEPGVWKLHNGAALSTGERVLVTSIVPGWGYGWHRVLKDEYVYEIVSWLLHYARQYVQRATVVQALMAILDVCGTTAHPFSETESSTNRYSDILPFPGATAAIQYSWASIEPDWQRHNHPSPQDPNPWCRANTVDPDIGQSAASFMRGCSLQDDGHDLEAVVAFDCVLQSSSSYLQHRNRLPDGATRSNVCAKLGLNARHQHSAEFAYFVRNNFGAHPRGWRWWDVGDVLDEDLAAARSLARAALIAMVEDEAGNRRIESEPEDWTQWLMENFSLIYDAVWFDALAEWQRDHPIPNDEEGA